MGRNAIERRAGLETGNAEADPPGLRGRLQAVGKRATRAPTGSAGVMAAARVEEGDGRNTGSPAGGVARANRQPARARSDRAGWRRGPQYRGSRVTPVEGRGLGSRAAHDGGRDVGTGVSLSASERVQGLQTALHAKAKEAPGFRFYSLCDKVWRDDVLVVAWQAVRRNGGAAGVDGEGCGSSSSTNLSPVHRLFCSLTVPSVRFSRGQAPTGLFIGQPARAARPDQRCLGASVRPTGAAPGHSRSVLVACRGKGDASEMAVVTTTRLSGRAFWVALGATRGRGRLDRRRHRAGETLKTVGVCPLVGNAQQRWRES